MYIDRWNILNQLAPLPTSQNKQEYSWKLFFAEWGKACQKNGGRKVVRAALLERPLFHLLVKRSRTGKTSLKIFKDRSPPLMSRMCA